MALDKILKQFHQKDERVKARMVREEDGEEREEKVSQEKLRIMVKKSRFVYGVCDQVAGTRMAFIARTLSAF